MHYTCVWPSRFVIWAEEAMGALSDNWFVRVGEVPPVVLWSEGWKWRCGPGWSCSVRLLEGRLCSFRRGVLACGCGGPTGRGLLSRSGASVALGEVSSLAAVGRLLEGRLWLWGAHWPRVAEPEGRLYCSGRGVLACCSGGPTDRRLLSRRGASVASGEGSSRAHWPRVAEPEGGLCCSGRGVLACGCGGPTGRGLLSRRGASVASGEGSSRAAVGDPLAGMRCASEG